MGKHRLIISPNKPLVYYTKWCLSSCSLKQFTWAGSTACTNRQQSFPQSLEFLQYTSQELDLVFLKGEKNPSSKQENYLLHVMRQSSCSFLCFLRQKWTCDHRQGIKAATLVAACSFWLNGHFPLPWYWEHWSPKCISTSSWYNVYFSCCFLPNIIFGNMFVGFTVTHSENTFIFTPLSLTPSNTCTCISMDNIFVYMSVK